MNQLIRIPKEKDNGGIKCQHASDNSDLDKETSRSKENHLAIVSSTPSQVEW